MTKSITEYIRQPVESPYGFKQSYTPASQIATRTRSNDLYAWNGAVALTRNYTNNGLNQHTTSGGIALAYDGRGNLTSDAANAYSYTLENRLVSGPNSALFTYDPFGRLTYQITGASLNVWQHDGDQMIREQDTAGNTFRRHVHGPGTDEPLLTYEGAGTSDKRYSHADERGSITAISNASGQVTQINAYDDYGIPQGKTPGGAVISGGTNTASFGRFGYTGQVWLPEVELNYYKARMYSPTLGRFMQTDPIGYGDGVNLYAYVGGDPVNFSDPLGLESRENDNSPAPIVVTGDRPSMGGGGSLRFGGKPSGGNFVQVGPIGVPATVESNGTIVVTSAFKFVVSGRGFGGSGFRGSGGVEKPPCAKASSGSDDFIDATLASENKVFSVIGNIADAAVVVGFIAAPLNPAVGGILIAGGKIGGAIVVGVQGGAAIIDATKNGNFGNALSLAGGQALKLVGGRLGARVGAKLFGNQQIRNSLGQFAGKRANGVRQAGQAIGNSIGSAICPN